MKTDVAYVYALFDPETDDVRYVGQSVDPVQRYVGHCLEDPTPKGQWVASLRTRGLLPTMRVLRCVPREHIDDREREAIAEFSSGHDLLNVMDLPHEKELPGWLAERRAASIERRVGYLRSRPKKTAASFRFSLDIADLLAQLAEARGVSQTAVLELLIRDAAKKEGLKK